MPYWAVITNLSLAPHIKNQFEVLFEDLDIVQDMDSLEALKKKRGLVDSFVMAPYSLSTEEDEPPPPAQPKTAMKKVTKKF
jgi:hypothetical protein